MTKADLIEKIATYANTTKTAAERTLNALLESMSEELKNDEKITLTGFGSFTVNHRKERKGRNPRTSEEITIPASRAAAFTPSKILKEALK